MYQFQNLSESEVMTLYISLELAATLADFHIQIKERTVIPDRNLNK